MRMQKRMFRIGELAEQLKVEKFVIRFWEKEFGIATTRSKGGQRFYSENDLATFVQIKHLLYDKGFTIAGAKKVIAGGKKAESVSIRASQKIPVATAAEQSEPKNAISKEVLLAYKQKLIKIRDLLQ